MQSRSLLECLPRIMQQRSGPFSGADTVSMDQSSSTIHYSGEPNWSGKETKSNFVIGTWYLASLCTKLFLSEFF